MTETWKETPVLTVYGQPNCPHCERVKNQLESLGEPYIEIDVAANPEQRTKLIELWGYQQVPVVEFEEDTICNPNPTQLEDFLYTDAAGEGVFGW